MPDSNFPSGTALVCPLDWGLGHASRCIPIIHALQKHGYRVVVAADGLPLRFLKEEFGSRLEYLLFPGKTVNYQKNGSFLWAFALQMPGFFEAIRNEHKYLNRLIDITGASLVVSDNRYGLFSHRAKTVLITHQVFIKLPPGLQWAAPFVGKLVRTFMNRFDFCWIPDNFDPPGLSGELSHLAPVPTNTRFVGPLSRFSAISPDEEINPLPPEFQEKFYFAILSGPEPQRGILEQILFLQFAKLQLPVVFALGKPGEKHLHFTGAMISGNHFNTREMAWLFKNAKMVICRSGYSTIMDLSVFGLKALLIPTPGQTEQEYLAEFLKSSGRAFSIPQAQLSLHEHLSLAGKYTGIIHQKPANKLDEAISELVQ